MSVAKGLTGNGFCGEYLRFEGESTGMRQPLWPASSAASVPVNHHESASVACLTWLSSNNSFCIEFLVFDLMQIKFIDSLYTGMSLMVIH